MSGKMQSPYPHHSWFADDISIKSPRLFVVHERVHAAHHLLLTTGGDAHIRWTTCGAEKVFHVVPGCLTFFPSDRQMHSMAITSGMGFAACGLIIPDRHLRVTEKGEVLPNLPTRLMFRDTLLEACLLRLVANPASHQLSEDVGDDIAARNVVLRLCSLVGIAAPIFRMDGSVFPPVVMRQVVIGIDGHLRVPFSLETMADNLRLSSGHFARKFQNSVGLSLERFINVRRINASFALLRQGTGSLAGTALDLGFSSQSHFTRQFSRLTGMSPDRFRRLHSGVGGGV